MMNSRLPEIEAMFTVTFGGETVFEGGYSAMNAYILDTYGSHMAAVKAGARMVPPVVA